MKRIFFLLIALFCLSQNSFAGSLNYARKDTQLHTAFSFMGSFALIGLLKELKVSTPSAVFLGGTAMLGIGLVKEACFDHRISKNDMAANGVGVLGSSAFFLSLDF